MGEFNYQFVLIEICLNSYIKLKYVVALSLDRGLIFLIQEKSLLVIQLPVELGKFTKLRNVTTSSLDWMLILLHGSKWEFINFLTLGKLNLIIFLYELKSISIFL